MYLRYAKVRDVKSPVRSHPTDSGIDLYIPDDFGYLVLKPTESILIPSGIKFEIPFGYSGIFMNKSGVASKKKLLVGAQVIDTFYSGEVHIDLHNVGNEDVILNPGDKIIQLIIFPIVCSGTLEIPETELYKDFITSEYRENNGFGSTDKK